MKTLHLSIMVIAALLSVTSHSAWASVSLSAYLPSSGESIAAHFKFEKWIVIRYPNGGKLRSLLEDKNMNVSFTENSDNNTNVRQLLQQLNSNLLVNKTTAAHFTNLTLNYKTTVQGYQDHADIDFSITLSPTLKNYVMNRTDDAATLGMSWITPVIPNPVVIHSQQFGDLEVNYPMNLIKNQIPEVYDILNGTAANIVLRQELINATTLGKSFGSWEKLFDPAYVLTRSCECNQVGQIAPLTTFSVGGTAPAGGWPENDTKFTADTDYYMGTIHDFIGPDVKVEGLASTHIDGDKWIISTTKVTRSDWIAVKPWYSLWWVDSTIGAVAVIVAWFFLFCRFKEN
ncbi:MAG: hypothetical protein KGH87_08785 [Thaumarchaeota archaeon]|nr:hypothetical protein [Nitrososphaerota archaeon]